MKSKNFSKKLRLNKKTITDLNTNELYNAKGGIDEWYHSIATRCPTCGIYSCETFCYSVIAGGGMCWKCVD